ncbi:MAG: transcription factor YdeB [Epulopiscium sp.]|nr:transcription factor YdeB [Candidatus Epulonipiscium sp.]
MEVLELFKVGDNVVYPMQGTGVIESIEERDFLGEKQQYYIIKMFTQDMQIMIPASKIKQSNLRLISDPATLDNILSDLPTKEPHTTKSTPPKQRYKIYMDKIKSGSLEESAEVIWDLVCLNKEKALNATEKKMLTNARKFLTGEMALIREISEDEANEVLDLAIG